MANSEARTLFAAHYSLSAIRSHSPIRPVPLALGRIERGDHDVLVAGAAAQVARDGDPHLLLGRVRIVAQELDQRGQDARRAEAALQAMVLMERLLQRMQLIGRGG